MLSRETLSAILREPPPTVPKPEVPRALAGAIPRSVDHVVVLTGVRRSGKSTLLGQLLRRSADAARLNFEDPRLYGIVPADFPMIIDMLEARPARAPIGLDEVQEVPGWQRLVRALLDRGRRVLVTGSNASLLGRELGMKLTGRHQSFEVSPFDYHEYLAWSGGAPGAPSHRTWLDRGGFPGYLRTGNDELLRELLRDVIYRDIAARHGLREIRHIQHLVAYLFAHTGQPVSLQRLTKSLQIPTMGQTTRYMEYLQDAYLVFALPKYSPSFKTRVVSPPKYYAVDNGLRRAASPAMTEDLGRRLENAVYLGLRSRGAVAGWAGERDAWECDFVTADAAIQACVRLTDDNRDREVRGLIRAVALPGARKRRAVIVTLDQSDRLSVDGLDVDVIPAWRWHLEMTPGSRSPRTA